MNSKTSRGPPRVEPGGAPKGVTYRPVVGLRPRHRRRVLRGVWVSKVCDDCDCLPSEQERVRAKGVRSSDDQTALRHAGKHAPGHLFEDLRCASTEEHKGC